MSSIMKRDNRWYGLRSDIPDKRDKLFTARPAGKLPATASMLDFIPPIMDQGELGSCTAHGITGALRTLLKKKGTPDIELSRLQLYYDERDVEGTVDSDAGAEIRDGIKCVAKIGVAHEFRWPYNIQDFTLRPVDEVYADAHKFEALTYKRVTISALAIKSALAAGYPVIIGIAVYESFESDKVAKTGIVPIPKRAESQLGGHCMYVAGYGQKKGYFTVVNSWGIDWGDNGLCYIPEAYLGDSNLGSDYWAITALKLAKTA